MNPSLTRFVAFGICAAALMLAGCEVFSGTGSSVREKFALRGQPRTHIYNADPRVTFEAARKAADQMGYRFVRGGAAQGELEAMSGVGTADSLGSSRQISLNAKLRPTLEGGTEMSLIFKELIEADSIRRAGQATATPMVDTPLYEVFFRTVQQVLDAPKK